MLILGSMPGEASLAAGQYYAHPRNSFWQIISALLGLPPEATYACRTQALVGAGLALWDVVRSCRRDGSLDTAIHRESVRVNDFRGFLSAHPRIGLICFNGGMAERLFDSLVTGRPGVPELPRLRLPSSSPAHAARSVDAKLQAWRAALGPALALTAGLARDDQASARP